LRGKRKPGGIIKERGKSAAGNRLGRDWTGPPVATDRLSGLPDGRLIYRLKRRWRDGTTHVIYKPLEFIEKLAAWVAPPRFNLVRYCGILAPSSGLRRQIIPIKAAGDPVSLHCCKAAIKDSANAGISNRNAGLHERRYAWAELLKRVCRRVREKTGPYLHFPLFASKYIGAESLKRRHTRKTYTFHAFQVLFGLYSKEMHQNLDNIVFMVIMVINGG
jgi:hypothetical protein